jgi:hypothetical protein
MVNRCIEELVKKIYLSPYISSFTNISQLRFSLLLFDHFEKRFRITIQEHDQCYYVTEVFFFFFFFFHN